MKYISLLFMAVALAVTGCESLGVKSTRTCEEPKDGYMRCTTTIVEDGVACIGSCAVKKK